MEEARKAGRPLGSRNSSRKDGVRVTLYLDRSALQRVDEMARRRKTSRTAILEEIIARAKPLDLITAGKVRAEDLAR